MKEFRISGSELKDFQKCKRLYYWKYILGFQPIERPVSKAMELGKEIHAYIEGFSIEQHINDFHGAVGRRPTEDEIKEAQEKFYKQFTPKSKVIANFTKKNMSQYTIIGKEVYAEKTFKRADYAGIHWILTGHIDFKTEKEVLELKTTSLASTEQEWNKFLLWEKNKPQRFFYGYLEQKPVVYMGVYTGDINQGKKETDEDFETRLKGLFEYPPEGKKYFQSAEIPFDEPKIDQYLENIQDELAIAFKTNLFMPNCDNCVTFGKYCPYFNMCDSEGKDTTGLEITEKSKRLLESNLMIAKTEAIEKPKEEKKVVGTAIKEEKKEVEITETVLTQEELDKAKAEELKKHNEDIEKKQKELQQAQLYVKASAQLDVELDEAGKNEYLRCLKILAENEIMLTKEELIYHQKYFEKPAEKPVKIKATFDTYGEINEKIQHTLKAIVINDLDILKIEPLNKGLLGKKIDFAEIEKKTKKGWQSFIKNLPLKFGLEKEDFILRCLNYKRSN